MNRAIELGLVAILMLSTNTLAAENKNRTTEHSIRDTISNVTAVKIKKVTMVDKLQNMFIKGKVTGNIRSLYSVFENKNDVNTYATAAGGSLKYELGELYGFNAGTTMRTTNDIGLVSGSDKKRNEDLSGAKATGTQLSEVYVNYRYEGIQFRAGRQIINTPLADSDDIRMTPDTFEAYVATYKQNGFSLMVAHLNSWQGYDAGLENGWVKTGKDGVNLGGLTYSNKFIDTSVWYYNISNASSSDIASGADENGNNSVYADISGHFNIEKNLFLHLNLQYLKQNELDGSNVKANIYGTMAQVIFDDLSVSIAYNKSIKQKGKNSFSGFGGGTLYTSMDTMILDEITEDRDAQATVGSLSYPVFDVNLLYAYGDFVGNANSSGTKEHIIAQNIGAEYTTENDLTLGAIFVMHQNKEDSTSTFYNDNNFRILASYNF
jgi:hypothetical protein